MDIDSNGCPSTSAGVEGASPTDGESGDEGPVIRLHWGNQTGPSDDDCRFEGSQRVCTISSSANLGRVPVGTVQEFTVVVDNAATCEVAPGQSPCGPCRLSLDTDGNGIANVDIEAGGDFRLRDPLGIDTELPQRHADCEGPGQIVVSFGPVWSAGPSRAVLQIESNSPGSQIVRLPLAATVVGTGPVALARLVRDEGLSETESHIAPFQFVNIDGSGSFDTADPSDPGRIVDYRWSIPVFPEGVNVADFHPRGQGTADFRFWPTLAGRYRVLLQVTNRDGVVSEDLPGSYVDIDVVPPERIHLQLVWDEDHNDQDLHLVWVERDHRICNGTYDVHWLNRDPVWFAEAAAGSGEGPNPRLDVDDVNGFGPENINIDEPRPGRYRVFVHYYSDTMLGTRPVRSTVRVYLDGRLAHEYSRVLTLEKDVWAVTDVVWGHDGPVGLEAYPSDVPGEVGAVATMQGCSEPGWSFPEP